MGKPDMTGTSSMQVGLIGCGSVSSQYFRNLYRYPEIRIMACADLDVDRARDKAEEFGVSNWCSVEELLDDTEVRMVINLTPPSAHAKVSLAAIAAGKDVYSEKPLAVSRKEGESIIRSARERGLMIGCAPDTFLGGGIQTCRNLIDEGSIGRPIAATAFILNHGHEHWHPKPAFFYQCGGGPMFDMGPYYLTALISLLGPIRRVTGSHGSGFSQRTITSSPMSGKVIDVEVPTHVAGVLDFREDVIATLVTSFDVWATRVPRIEIYGTEGTLAMPDPNTFGGPVAIQTGREEWRDVQLTHPEGGRGLGVAEMAASLRKGRKSRVDVGMASHVLEVMHAVHQSSNESKHVTIRTSCEKPTPVPLGLVEGQFDS